MIITHTNPYFSTTTGYSGEQQLLDDLTIEQIAIYGLDIYFMPRKLMNMDKLFNESSKSAFENGYAYSNVYQDLRRLR